VTTPTPPVPGFVAPSPRTWSKGDMITTPRLRGDMANLAYLYAGGARPMLYSVNDQSQAPAVGSDTLLYIGNIVPLNSWNVPVIGSSGGNPYYQVPLAGYYLVQGDVNFVVAGSPASFKYAMGFSAVINGAASISTDGGAVPSSTATTGSFGTGMAGLELFQMNTFAATADTLAMYCFTNNTNPFIVDQAAFMIEWVGLPTSGLTSYTGPYGTVVAAPQAAALFPPGPGTTQTAGITPGATFISVASNTGIVVGGTLGLGYINGVPIPPGSTGAGVAAEAVSVTSVAGPTIGISATAYGHASGDPVAVPVSAAFLNQQCRDIIRFLAYPPLVRAVPQTTQSIPSQTFPSATQITGFASTIDTFSGFASNAYTVPVSGVYLVYGQVYWAGSTSAFACGTGVSISGGTIQWGTLFRYNGGTARTLCSTFRRHMRLTAGQTITLFGTQNVGSAMNTVLVTGNSSKLIAVWRCT
jgi:hypothetical protein